MKAILFDLDGVLVESKDIHYEALNLSLSRHGFRPIDYPDHLQRFDGKPTRVKLGVLSVEQGISAEQVISIERIKQQIFLELARAKLSTDPRLFGELRALRNAGYRLGVCSNAVRATLDFLLHALGIASLFEVTLSNGDVQNPKPDPEIYRTAMARLGLTPDDCLIVEDNPVGIEAGRASGARVLVVKGPLEVTAARILDACAASTEALRLAN